MTQTTGQALAQIVVRLAQQAAKSGTFGVGGLLMGPDGQILKEMLNGVIRNGVLADPTAHVERHLIDWYYAQTRHHRRLPSPSECLIVSSLDPCVMCSGAILASGFKVLSVAMDRASGISWKAAGNFSTLPSALREAASQAFSYFGIMDGRPYTGPQHDLIGDCHIPHSIEKLSTDAFLKSLDTVMGRVNLGPVGAADLIDPASLLADKNSWLYQAYREIKRTPLPTRVDPVELGEQLGPVLIQKALAAFKNGNAFDAAALVDPFGNVLMASGGREKLSPIRTAFMELTRNYALLRVKAKEAGHAFLPHPKHCTIVTLKGPGRSAQDIMALGAFGSTMEGQIPDRASPALQYIIPQQSEGSLAQMVRALPPLYAADIKISPQRVKNKGLIFYVETALTSALSKH